MPDRIGRLTLAIAAALAAGAARAGERYGIGRSGDAARDRRLGHRRVAERRRAAAGRGDVRQGEAIFAAKCAACHGARGEGKPMDRLVGGFGTLRDKKPEKTVGSYWPYATTLFDYVRRAMPLNAPQSLTPDEVYAVSAYVLFLNGIVPQDTTLDADNLAKINMPNRNGFVSAYPAPEAAAKP